MNCGFNINKNAMVQEKSTLPLPTIDFPPAEFAPDLLLFRLCRNLNLNNPKYN